MRSLQNQILAISFLLVSLCIFSLWITILYLEKKTEYKSVNESVKGIEVLLLKAFTEQESFINFELTNTHYYKSGDSRFLNSFGQHLENVKNELASLESIEFKSDDVKYKVNQIQKEIDDYSILFEKFESSIRKRGYKSLGIVGRMRKAVHFLEDSSSIDKTDLLMLRRHEKDFIIRQEQQYIQKFDKVITKLKSENRSKAVIIKFINDYDFNFQQLATYDRIIGIKSNTGYKQKLNYATEEILNNFERLNLTINLLQKQEEAKLTNYIIIFWLIALLVLITLIFSFSKRLSLRISKLSLAIQDVVSHNFSKRMNLSIQSKKDEVSLLSNNVLKMENELHDYINHFIEKVHDKTSELREKNEQIESQNSKILSQKEEFQQQNKDLLDGMRYGWRIQRALIPDDEKFKESVEKGFVYFSPKEIVSGDIYWTRKVLVNDLEETLFSVIDCTGHGVPGAFMSILAINAINDAVFRKHTLKPKALIQATNLYVYNAMKYYTNSNLNSNVKDGMDLAFCKLNRNKNKLSYVGACRPLYLMRKLDSDADLNIGLDEDEYRTTVWRDYILYDVFPLKYTVGTIDPDKSNLITSKELNVKKGDYIYIFSDGYADQFGGPKDKKFLTKRLKSLLFNIYELPPSSQKEILQNTISDWKGQRDQIDDICVMGVQV